MLLLFDGAGKPTQVRLTSDNNVYIATELTEYKFVDVLDLVVFFGNDREKANKHTLQCTQMKEFLSTLKEDSDRAAYLVKEMSKLGFVFKERIE